MEEILFCDKCDKRLPRQEIQEEDFTREKSDGVYCIRCRPLPRKKRAKGRRPAAAATSARIRAAQPAAKAPLNRSTAKLPAANRRPPAITLRVSSRILAK